MGDDHVGLPTFNILSLCTGYGGLELGLRFAIGNSRVVACVEHEAYTCEVLATRMEAKELDQAPIWSDVKTFDGKPWRGLVDCITGGYPCQPFSAAGRQQGIKDPRHIFPDIARIIGEVQPEWVFLENVANHLRIGFQEVRGRLQELGYHIEAGLFTASEVGAPHRRERLFILAHRDSDKWPTDIKESNSETDWRNNIVRNGGIDVAFSVRIGRRGRDFRSDNGQEWEPEIEVEGCGDELGNSASGRKRTIGARNSSGEPQEQAGDTGGDMDDSFQSRLEGRWADRCDAHQLPTWPPSPTDISWRDIPEQCWPSEKTPERNLRGMANGNTVRVDRLRLCGNGVVPVVAAMAWIYLRRSFVE